MCDKSPTGSRITSGNSVTEEKATIDCGGNAIAYRKSAGKGPTVIWLGGFRSDMSGSKASSLAAWAESAGRAFIRFDYSGHGASGGAFVDGSISVWLAETLAIIDQLAQGDVVLVGSSMGGWIATLAGLARPERLAGLVLIAPALDFTKTLIWDELSEARRRDLIERGRLEQPSDYSDEPDIITHALIEDGRRHLLLDRPIAIGKPVRILQGMADADVPWRHSLLIAERFVSKDLDIQLMKSGDHRLSRPRDIAAMIAAVETIGDNRDGGN